jgi:spore coat polysaccharide biosynthesis protein SpsF
MTAVALQARLDSNRLPGKALLPLNGKPIIFRVMEALKTVKADLYILASPEDCAAAFTPLAEEAGFVFCAGPRDDVLGRYCQAIRRFGIDRVIRATGDNPFVFADAADALNEEAVSLNAAYAGYSGLPYGAGVESVASWALLKAEAEAPAVGPEREHVCPYLYNHPEIFPLHRPLAPIRWQGPSFRVTVDTPEDYEGAAKLYAVLSRRTGADLPMEKFSSETRYRGETIINACKEMEHPTPFPPEGR